MTSESLSHLTQLSPVRHTTDSEDAISLAKEQALHFGVDPNSNYGKAMVALATQLYRANESVHTLWRITLESLTELDRSDRVAYFNCKRFLCFQLAKILDTLQNPMRATYQSITCQDSGFVVKGNFPLFDNVTALFSATPVITRTATCLSACTEWIEDGFKGREPLHEIYSRLLNPTSISLANHIVDIECGPYARTRASGPILLCILTRRIWRVLAIPLRAWLSVKPNACSCLKATNASFVRQPEIPKS
jgi:hypothetical protein